MMSPLLLLLALSLLLLPVTNVLATPIYVYSSSAHCQNSELARKGNVIFEPGNRSKSGCSGKLWGDVGANKFEFVGMVTINGSTTNKVLVTVSQRLYKTLVKFRNFVLKSMCNDGQKECYYIKAVYFNNSLRSRKLLSTLDHLDPSNPTTSDGSLIASLFPKIALICGSLLLFVYSVFMCLSSHRYLKLQDGENTPLLSSVVVEDNLLSGANRVTKKTQKERKEKKEKEEKEVSASIKQTTSWKPDTDSPSPVSIPFILNVPPLSPTTTSRTDNDSKTNSDILIVPGQNDRLLLSKLRKVSHKWFLIGIGLIGNGHTLRNIHANYMLYGVERCMIELINAWSKESIEGSYLSTLLKALMDVGLVSDAEGIARDYGINLPLVKSITEDVDFDQFDKDCSIECADRHKLHRVQRHLYQHGIEELEYQQQIRRKEADEIHLKEEVKDLREQVENLTALINEKMRDKMSKVELYSKKKQHITYLEQNKDFMSREIQSDIEESCKRLENELSLLKEEIQTKEQENTALKNQLEAKEKELADAQANISALHIALRNVMSTLLIEQSYLNSTLFNHLMKEAQLIEATESDSQTNDLLSLNKKIFTLQATCRSEEEELSNLRVARAEKLSYLCNSIVQEDICKLIIKSDCIGGFLESNQKIVQELLPILPGNPSEIVTELVVPWDNSCPLENVTLLHLACKNGWLHIANDLLTTYNCNPSVQSSGGYTPLHFACIEGHLPVVQFFIQELNMDVNAQNIQDKTLLHLACKYNHVDIVQFLIKETSLDIIQVDSEGKSAFHYAQNESVLRCLKEACGDVESTVKVLLLGQDNISPMKLEGFRSSLSPSVGIVPIYKDSDVGMVVYTVPDHAEYMKDSLLDICSPTLIVLTLPSVRRRNSIHSVLQYWLQFVKHLRSTTGSKLGLAIALNSDDSSKDIEIAIQECVGDFNKYAFTEVFFPPNAVLNKERLKALTLKFKSLVASSSLPFNCHLLYKFIQSKADTCLKLDSLMSSFSQKVPSMQLSMTEVADNLTDLTKRGLVVFMKNNVSLKDSWLILQPVDLLLSMNEKIHESYTSEQSCPSLLQLTELQNLASLGNNLNELAVNFLCYFQLCKRLDCPSLKAVFSDTTYNLQEWFYCPFLLSRKQESGSLVINHSFTSTWLLTCTQGAFPKSFTQALSLYFAYIFLSDKERCTLWKGAITWRDQDKSKVTVETYEENKVISVHFSSEEMDKSTHVFIRSKVIKAIIQLKAKILPNLDTEETLVRQAKGLYCEVALKDLVQAIVKGTPYVQNTEKDQSVLVKDVITFDCFECVKDVLIKKLFNPEKASKRVKDKFLRALAECMAERQDPQILGRVVFNSPKVSVIIHRNKGKPFEQFYKLLCNWRDCDQDGKGTYLSLQKLFSSFSVCAGRNPLDWCDKARFPSSLSLTGFK